MVDIIAYEFTSANYQRIVVEVTARWKSLFLPQISAFYGYMCEIMTLSLLRL